MKRLEDKVFETIKKYSMPVSGSDLIIAVSGGADSMCLLHLFNKFSSRLNINKLICAHVNHGIRGKEADRDEAFVRNFCSDNGIEFASAHYNIPELAALSGESIELCARRMRYAFFSSLSNDALIATAHNLNDSAETFIFNLARGTGLKGLTGIPAVRDNIIRPLTECSREEIEAYLASECVDFVTDSTNNSDDYSRNKIRHNIIPILNEINPSFYKTFLSCTNTLGDTEKYLDSIAESSFTKALVNNTFSVAAVNECDDVIRLRVLMKIAEFYGACDVEKKHIALLDGILSSKGAVMLHNGIKIASDGYFLYKEIKDIPEEDIYKPLVEGIYTYEFSECIIEFRHADLSEIADMSLKRLSENGYIKASALRNAVFRSRKNGDRFKFPSAEHSKSLKNLFKEHNISKQERSGIPFLADDENILWIDKIGVSDYACANETYDEILKITVWRKVNVL